MSPKQLQVTPVRRTSAPLACRRLPSKHFLPGRPSATSIPTRINRASSASKPQKLTFLERLEGRPGHTPVAKLRRERTTKESREEMQEEIVLLKQIIEQKEKVIRLRDLEISSLKLVEELLLRYGALA